MSGGEKIKSFGECLAFFNIPRFPFEMLSDSEKLLTSICHRIYIEGVLDFDDINIGILDENNKKRLAELGYQLLSEM